MTELQQCLMAVLPFMFNLVILFAAFKDRKKSSRLPMALVWVTAVASGGVLALILDITVFVRIFPFCYIVFFCMLTILLCKWVFTCSTVEALFLYFVIQSYIDDCLMIAKAIQTNFMEGMKSSISFLTAYGALLLLGMPVLLYFANKKLKVLIDSTKGMYFWRYMWIMPVSFYLVYRTGISPQYITLDLPWMNSEVIVPILWAIATIICYLMVINSLLGAVRQTEDRDNLIAAKQMLEMQKQQYLTLQGKIEETKQMKHDMRHQLLAIQGYADKGDMDGLKGYLKQYLEQTDRKDTLTYCGNYAVDSIIQYFLNQVKDLGAECSVKANFPRDMRCSEYEICIILGNLLENAVEACRRQKEGKRYIHLTINSHNDHMTAVQVINSCSDDIRKEGDIFLSGKRQFCAGGLGIASVQKLTDKYHGIACFEYSDYQFRSSVLF